MAFIDKMTHILTFIILHAFVDSFVFLLEYFFILLLLSAIVINYMLRHFDFG